MTDPSVLTDVEQAAADEAFQRAVVDETNRLVAQAGEAVAALHRHFENNVAEGDLWAAATCIAATKRIVTDLDVTYGDERRKVRPLLGGHASYAGPGVVLTKDYGKQRTEWQTEALLWQVLPALVAEADKDVTTRAEDMELQELGRRLTPLLLGVLRPDWKVGERDKPGTLDEATGEVVGRKKATGLRRYGIDPSDWCVEKSVNTVTVTVT